jgi:hypothetical protein
MDPSVMAMLQKSISAKLCPTVIGRCQVLPRVLSRCQAQTALVGDNLYHCQRYALATILHRHM